MIFRCPFFAKYSAPLGDFLPDAAWDGTAGSGFTTPPTDPTRTIAKPTLRLLVPPNQYFTDTITVGVMAAANNSGTLLSNLGLTKVVCHFEGMTRDITAPTVHTFNDVNGVSRSYLGWWVTLKKPAGTAGHANVYFEAIPADAAMQSRVIGPYQFSPQTTLHDLELEVAATPSETVGVRYKTLAAALSYCRTSTKNNPRITITEMANYDLTSAGTAYNPQGYATIQASVPVTITRPAAYSGGATTYFRTGFDGMHFKGSNITIDMVRMEHFYHENPSNRRHWFDGVTITDSGGRYYLNRGTPHGFGGALVRDGGIFTECTVSNVANTGGDALLVRGCAFQTTFNDIGIGALCFVYNTVRDHSSEEYRTELPALTVTGPAGATIEYSGAAGANNRVFNAKVSGTSVGTFTTVNTEAGWAANTNYTVANVVAWINSLGGGWSATLLDNTRYAAAISKIGNPLKGGAFGATACSSPLTLITSFDQHSDVWATSNGGATENMICWGNRCWLINSQGMYVNVATKDIVIANNSLHGLGGYVSNMGGIQSHVVFAHNSYTGQVISLRNDAGYNPDGYCAYLTNTAPELRYVNTGSPDAQVIIKDNHLQTGAIAPGGAGVSGTTVGGTGATLFVDAANGDFTPAGALLTNLKTPTIARDQRNISRAGTDAAGALAN